jgi:dipeptidyl aminopeptidase/acylaminoacyl peptidase
MTGLTGPDGRAAGWQHACDFFERVLAPGLGTPTAAGQAALHPHDDVVAVTVEVRTAMTGGAEAQVALVSERGVELLRPGHRPAWSPDGTRLAHLVDQGLRVDDVTVQLDGYPERFAWSPDSSRLLVVVAEHGSEKANLDGSGVLGRPDEADSWVPHVSSDAQHVAWRRLVVLDLPTLRTRAVGRTELNVWDACWCGADAVLAVCSEGSPTESAWYGADLRRIDLGSGADEVLVKQDAQFGAVAASPSGARGAYVTAHLSDRDLAAGTLHVLDLATGAAREVDASCDVSFLQLLDDDTVAFAGVRGLVSVIGTVTGTGQVTSLWESERETAVGVHPQASFSGGRVGFVRAGFALPPEVCLLRDGAVETLASLAHRGSSEVTGLGWTSEVSRWLAEDGVELEGWLHLPAVPGPRPLVVHVHGGPVTSVRSGWSGGNPLLPYLLSQGYAVWQPNPRGSSGRGAEFAGAVVGDMGGADARDLVAGVEALLSSGRFDPDRVGVMGGSYGGFMSAWLVTQTDLFAAAVPMFPVTDWTQQHGVSSIPGWDERFLDGRPYALDGQYRDRSPLTHVARVRTPTLFLAGGLDRATPPGQAMTMHRALVAQGVPSECVTYPQEGHGTKDLSATIDLAARISDWFERWMPARA